MRHLGVCGRTRAVTMRSDAVSNALEMDVTERACDVYDFNDVGHDHDVTIEYDFLAYSARFRNW